MSAEVERLRKLLAAAQAKSLKAMEARHKLPAGSSRARVTTANARWARAAEARDLLAAQLGAAEADRDAQAGAGIFCAHPDCYPTLCRRLAP